MRLCVAAYLVFSALILFPGPATALEEDVEATPGELFSVSREILSESGLDIEDPEKGILQSQWIEDTVMRTHPHLGGFAQKRFDRRTRLRIEITPWTVFTKIRLLSEFRYRPAGSSRTAPWRELKPDSSDYAVEQVYFGRILEKLGTLRTAEHTL